MTTMSKQDQVEYSDFFEAMNVYTRLKTKGIVSKVCHRDTIFGKRYYVEIV